MMGESEYKARERAMIVAKYDAQRTPEILPGEEGPQDLNHLDLYGFIYPSPVQESVLEKQRRIKQRDLKREKKWDKLMPKKGSKKPGKEEGDRAYGHTLLHLDDKLFRPKKTHEKLVRRVYDGIPATLRSLIWTELLRMQGMRVNHEKYKEMVERAKKYSPDIHQIDLDVNRTYRNTSYFRERYGPRQRQLFDVLAAYSMYNTEVGYCQGMSEIAAFLLMHLNEEADVFWALHTLFTHQHWQMHGFFIKGFPKLNRFFDHHDRLLAKHLPRLYKHLKKMDIHPSCYAFKWFMQCFIGLPFTLTLRLWDIFLVIGEKLLVVMSFNIMKIIRRSLMKMDQSEILVFMQEPLRRRLAEFDDDKIIEELKDAMNELQHDWRPPKSTIPEGPPSPEQFGRRHVAVPQHLVQERQADQADVEATLRRSFQRSGSPRPPSSPSAGDAAPHRRSPPPPLSLPDGSLAVAAVGPDGSPPSPYDNAPLPLLGNPPSQQTYPLPQVNPPPPQQTYPLSQQGNPPPQQTYPLPQVNPPPPQQTYPLPQQGNPSPPQTYPSPQQGNPPPPQTYPSSQVNPPPQQTYPLPQVNPSPQANPPPQQAYPSPQVNPPPQQAYPSSQVNPPPQQAYPSSQVNPPPQQAYPSSQVNPPPQQAYPSPQVNPPPQQAYPLPQVNPPPQQAYPSSQVNPPPKQAYPLPQVNPPPQQAYPLPQVNAPSKQAYPSPQQMYPLPQVNPSPQVNPPPQQAYPRPQVNPSPQVNPPPQQTYPRPQVNPQPQPMYSSSQVNPPPQQVNPYPLPQVPIVMPSPPASKPPSIVGHVMENPRAAPPPTYNGGVRSAVPKSHSLPEDVALASQLDLMKDYQPASRQVRSQASSPLEAPKTAPIEPPKMAPLESTI